MAREVEKDWERAGDYLRAGLDGREFFRSPKPRWESLHDLQGLLEMYRITGEAKYRDAFVHHWRSIRRWDRRNTGGFSSGEQATGNPYTPSAIETCCTVAWMALTIDYLRLTGDSLAADDLELATLNGGLGAQHPSGRWWTYNTPMDGVREASAHSIVFQARAGTPELNCCSVNAPRVLGMLSEWAVMSASNAVVVNWLGAGEFLGKLSNGASVRITSTRDAWRDGETELRVSGPSSQPFTVKVRVPSWAREPQVKLNGSEVGQVVAGNYWQATRVWSESDRITLTFEPAIRFIPGANEAAGKVSLYRGPLLLAYDQAQNDFDEVTLPAVDLRRLSDARLAESASLLPIKSLQHRPWLTVEVPTADGRLVRLVDFASAGAAGTRYRSWLPAKLPPPPPAMTQLPPDSGRVPVGPVLFQWRGARARKTSYRAQFSPDVTFGSGSTWSTNVSTMRVVLNTESLAALTEGKSSPIYWRVVAVNENSETIADVPPAWFVIDPAAPPQILPAEPKLGPNGEMIVHLLRGADAPQFGELKSAKFSSRDGEGTEVNGRNEMLTYALPAWPEEDFTVSVRVNIKELPQKRIGQVFSAWAGGMDDPLRVVVDGGKIFARIEAGGGFSTPGAPIEAGRWYAVAAIKRGGTLTLVVDGRAVGSCAAPEFTATQAQDCALGGNPHFSGNEFLAARFADFRFYARPLSSEEIQALTAVR
jgi:hypothetical protein